jgi:hypothetical protein
MHTPETGAHGQARVDPTRSQLGVISGAQIRSKATGNAATIHGIGCNPWPRFECIALCRFRVLVMHPFVERIQVSPPRSMARAVPLAIPVLGRERYGTMHPMAFQQNGGRPVPRCRIKTVSILPVLSPQEMSAERKQTPQVVENHRSRWIVWRIAL